MKSSMAVNGCDRVRFFFFATYTCLRLHIYALIIYMSVYVCMNIYMSVHVCMRCIRLIYACRYTDVCGVCVACMHVYTRMYALYAFAYIHVYTRMHMCTYAYMSIHVCMRCIRWIYTCLYTYAHVHARTRTRTRTCIHAHTHTCADMCCNTYLTTSPPFTYIFTFQVVGVIGKGHVKGVMSCLSQVIVSLDIYMSIHVCMRCMRWIYACPYTYICVACVEYIHVYTRMYALYTFKEVMSCLSQVIVSFSLPFSFL